MTPSYQTSNLARVFRFGDVYPSDKTNMPMKTYFHVLANVLLATTLPVFSQNQSETPKTESKAENGQKPGQAPTSETNVFTFNGGQLRNFINSFKGQLGMDLYEVASIEPKALNMQVPKIKIPLGRTPPGSAWELVLGTYNQLSVSTEQSLGRWVIVRAVGVGNNPSPNAIIFTPPKNLADLPSLKVKAFSMHRLSEDQFGTLHDLVILQANELRRSSESSGNGGNFEGQLRYHAGTGLLIATGGQEFVELAGTIIEAYREAVANRRIPDTE
jgi:hypothetical protein